MGVLASHLILVGLRCSGKTTVGRRVAETIGARFVDADVRFAAEQGVEISEFVRREGWSAFRRAESIVLDRLLSESPSVIATGGGVVLDPENRLRMRAAGLVVYLRLRADVAASRLANADAIRPPLTAFGPVDEARAMFADRDGVYRGVCHVIVDAESDLEHVTAAVVALI